MIHYRNIILLRNKPFCQCRRLFTCPKSGGRDGVGRVQGKGWDGQGAREGEWVVILSHLKVLFMWYSPEGSVHVVFT